MKNISTALLAVAVGWLGYATYVSGKFQVGHLSEDVVYKINTHTGEMEFCFVRLVDKSVTNENRLQCKWP